MYRSSSSFSTMGSEREFSHLAHQCQIEASLRQAKAKAEAVAEAGSEAKAKAKPNAMPGNCQKCVGNTVRVRSKSECVSVCVCVQSRHKMK